MGPRRQEDGEELYPSTQGSIEVVDLENEGSILHQAPFTRTEEANRIVIFHNHLEHEGYTNA